MKLVDFTNPNRKCGGAPTVIPSAAEGTAVLSIGNRRALKGRMNNTRRAHEASIQ